MSKKSKITRPNRDPDHYSKRDVPYWWSPEWIRGTTADGRHTQNDVDEGYIDPSDCILDTAGTFIVPCESYGKIHAVKEKKTVNLYMKSKEGKLNYIQGSIQDEFKRWHEDRQIDYILLGMDPDEILANED